MSRCNCPPPRDVWRYGVTTKDACPVHETAGMLAELAKQMVPRVVKTRARRS